MKVECPKCQAKYQIPDDKIPPGGKRGRCVKCGQRFQIPPVRTSPKPIFSSSDQDSGMNRPTTSGNKTSNAQTEKRKSPISSHNSTKTTHWQESLYNRLFRYIQGFYRLKNSDQRYYISAFTFAYRDIPSGTFIKSEVSRLKTLIKKNETHIKKAQRDNDWETARVLQSENLRHKGMISVFRDIVGLKDHFAKEGQRVNFNMVFTVLKDVELFFEKVN